MRKVVFSILLAGIVMSLSGCASKGGLAGDSVNNSMLLIGAWIEGMDPDGHVYNDEGFWAASLSVKNIGTDNIYRVALNQEQGIKTLPAGLYCLYSVDNLDYCGKPFFKLNPHKVTNAGYFIFAIDSRDHRYKLVKALACSDYLFKHLTKADRNAMAEFMNNQP